MRLRQICFRGHEPKFSSTPVSGKGANQKGGRFNPPGEDVLYLSLSVGGVITELGYGFGHAFDPVTICAYDVDVEDILDLRTADQQRDAGVLLTDMACDWLREMAKGNRPKSWDVQVRAKSLNAAGMIVPSFARGAKPSHANLVLWNWGPDLPHRVRVIDPKGRLPKNQLSWD